MTSHANEEAVPWKLDRANRSHLAATTGGRCGDNVSQVRPGRNQNEPDLVLRLRSSGAHDERRRLVSHDRPGWQEPQRSIPGGGCSRRDSDATRESQSENEPHAHIVNSTVEGSLPKAGPGKGASSSAVGAGPVEQHHEILHHLGADRELGHANASKTETLVETDGTLTPSPNASDHVRLAKAERAGASSGAAALILGAGTPRT